LEFSLVGLVHAISIGALIGAIVGFVAGGIYGVAKYGMSWKALKCALIGLIGGAVVGAILGATAYLLGPLFRTGLRQLLIKAQGIHTTAMWAAVAGFAMGLVVGLLWPDLAGVTIASAIATLSFVIADSLIRGAIWQRHEIAALVGTWFATWAKTFLFTYAQAATFVLFSFSFGFAMGYITGSGIRKTYDLYTN
jgi:hypothetical protein